MDSTVTLTVLYGSRAIDLLGTFLYVWIYFFAEIWWGVNVLICFTYRERKFHNEEADMFYSLRSATKL